MQLHRIHRQCCIAPPQHPIRPGWCALLGRGVIRVCASIKLVRGAKGDGGLDKSLKHDPFFHFLQQLVGLEQQGELLAVDGTFHKYPVAYKAVVEVAKPKHNVVLF